VKLRLQSYGYYVPQTKIIITELLLFGVLIYKKGEGECIVIEKKFIMPEISRFFGIIIAMFGDDHRSTSGRLLP